MTGHTTQHHVLVLAPQPFYQDRGTPIAVRLVLEALSELGHLVDVLTFPIGSDPGIERVRIYRTGNPFGIRAVPVGFSVRKLVLDAGMARGLSALLRRYRYTYVHAVEEAAFLAAVLARRRGVPVLYDMQSSLPEQLQQRAAFRSGGVQAVLRACERWLLDHVDLIVGSTGLAPVVRALEPAAPFHEWTFPPSFPPATPEEIDQLRAALHIPEGSRVVLYSGTFEPYQGLEQLVESVPAVRAAIPNALFVLVGAEGRTGDTLARHTARMGLSDAIRLVDRQPRQDLGGYLALANVFVSPRNHGQNIPLKVFDYLAAERPIVATAIPAHRAVLDETRAELVEGTPAGIAGGIIRVLSTEAHAGRLVSAASAYARKHFGWDGFVAKVGELADYLAETGRKQPPAASPGRRQAA